MRCGGVTVRGYLECWVVSVSGQGVGSWVCGYVDGYTLWSEGVMDG